MVACAASADASSSDLPMKVDISVLESPAYTHGRSFKLQTESCFGMRISPYVQTAQPYAEEARIPAFMPAPEARNRLRTDSSLSTPISPWAQHEQFAGLQLPQFRFWQSSPGEEQPTCTRSTSTDTVSTTCSASDCLNTTLMLRNLPEGFNRAALVHLLNSQGFAKRYDFAYLPVNFDTLSGLTHAFINMLSPDDAQRAKAHFEGFSAWEVPSDKLCHALWNDKQQGLLALTERYRNSPVMHQSVPDQFKPMVLIDGKRCPFPPPSQKVKAPKKFRPKC